MRNILHLPGSNATEPFEHLIHDLRGQKVMLDADLARVYGVPTKALNQAVKRNQARFPADFAFRITAEELAAVATNRSQFVTGSQKHRDPLHLPYAFTEHGALMAANVLNSSRAVQMSVFVMRAFVRMRSLLGTHTELARQLKDIETKLAKLTTRMNGVEPALLDVLQHLMRLLDPPPQPEPSPKPPIGFQVREAPVRYGARLKHRRA